MSKEPKYSVSKMTKVLQNLYRENVRLEEKVDRLIIKTEALETVLTLLLSSYKDIQDFEKRLLKGLDD